MSKIIASAAIRGAHKIVGAAENKLKQAIDAFGPDKDVAFPNTGYYLPSSTAYWDIKWKNSKIWSTLSR